VTPAAGQIVVNFRHPNKNGRILTERLCAKNEILRCMISNCISVDFEEWYQGLTSTSVQYARWPTFESRIERQTSTLLETFQQYGIKATFFVVGEIARLTPDVLREIARHGHEIGLHGNRHQRVDKMSEIEFREDLERNYEAVRAVVDTPIQGYRAAYTSVSDDTTWFWQALQDRGLSYDSSVFPVRTPLYGMPGANPYPSVVGAGSGSLVEIPITTVALGAKRLPFSGGVWFRNLAYSLVKRITASKNRAGEPVVFYFHPWEFDPDHPRPSCTTARERLSHYSGLKSAHTKLCRLLHDFEFQPMSDYASELKLNLQAPEGVRGP